MMTLEQLEAIPGEMLTPAQAAQVLGVDRHTLATQAKQAPGLLGFPVCICGNRVRIPKRALMRFLRGE